MNQGVFWCRDLDAEKETGKPVFRTVHGYIVKKWKVRVGIYRITTDGLSSYKAIDLRDGIELANGLTIHEATRYASPLPTAGMIADEDVFNDVRLMWDHIMTHPQDDVTLPAY